MHEYQHNLHMQLESTQALTWCEIHHLNCILLLTEAYMKRPLKEIKSLTSLSQ